jgi:hypothetical protein
MMRATLTVEQRSDGWWVTGLPDDTPDVGPYDTKAEAESDRRGMSRFYRQSDKPGFMTADPAASGGA